MRRVVLALCFALATLPGLTQADIGLKGAATPRWFRQYPPMLGNPVSIACPGRSTCYAAGTDGAILRTADAGRTWWRESVPLPAGFLIRAIACRASSDCVVSADDRGRSLRTVILATRDGGHTWQRRYSTALGGTEGLACPANGDCFALVHGGVFAAGSEGGKWAGHDLPLPTTAMAADGLACPAPESCFVDAHENRGDGYGAILSTTDGGVTWKTHIIGPNRTHGYFNGISCPDARTCYVVSIARTSVVLVTHDAWQTQAYHPVPSSQAPNPGAGSNYYAQPVCPDERTCYLRSTFGTVASTSDGGQTWHEHTLDRTSLPFSFSYFLPQGVTGMACPTVQRCLAVQVNGNIAFTTDGGAVWNTVFIGTARPLWGVACAGPATCLAIGPDSTLLETRNGVTWSRRPYPLGDARSTLLAIACHGSKVCVAAGTGGAIARTRDAGAPACSPPVTYASSPEVGETAASPPPWTKTRVVP